MTEVTLPSDRIDSRINPALFASVFIIVAILLLYLNSLSTVADAEAGYIVLSDAEALPRDLEHGQLSAADPQWNTIELPIHWRDRFADSLAVWYRMQISGAALESLSSMESNESEPLLGIYIWRINQTADIWFNGTRIGSGGSTVEPMARHWNSPLYFTIPVSLIQDQNEILVKHFAQHSWGSMEAIIIGSDSLLSPIFEQRYFIQHDIALGLFVFVVVSGLFCFTIWFNRRREDQYLWFAIASVGLGFFCLNQFIRYLPIDADLWRWLSNITTDLWATALFIFLLRSLQIENKVAERVVLSYLASGVPIYFYASFYHVFDINVFYHIGSLLIAVYGFYLCVRKYVQTRETLPAFYCCVLVLVFIAGVHDTFMQAVVNNGWLSESELGFLYHFNFVHFAAPLIFLFIGATLVKRFIDSMNQADLLNLELEQRVSDAREELAENYKAIEAVLVKQSASEERERIYRDLHDDVGSKLLSLYYRLDKESDSTLAKSALEDLRDIVSSKSLDSCSLSVAAQEWRSEAFNRTRDAGIKLDWRFDVERSYLMLDESQRAQLRRMLREVLSNAILHNPQINEIRVKIDYGDHVLRISVSNNGVETSSKDWEPGRGISNLRVRARDLGGEFLFEDIEENWVRVTWDVPLNGSS